MKPRSGGSQVLVYAPRAVQLDACGVGRIKNEALIEHFKRAPTGEQCAHGWRKRHHLLAHASAVREVERDAGSGEVDTDIASAVAGDCASGERCEWQAADRTREYCSHNEDRAVRVVGVSDQDSNVVCARWRREVGVG